MIPRPAALLLLAFPLAACSKAAPDIHLQITPGQEHDTFSLDPAVTTVKLTTTSLDKSVNITTSTTPNGSFTIGDIDETEFLSFDVQGLDAQGDAVVGGRSLSGIQLGGDGGTLPIFVQRKERWSRPPGGIPRPHVAAPAGVLGAQYLFIAGGGAGTEKPGEGDFYDMLSLGGVSGGSLPRVPESIVSGTVNAILINADGATLISAGDASNPAGSANLDAPVGTSFADVAGGREVDADTGTTFVVGPTRADKPTTGVLVIDQSANLNIIPLKQARAGAASIWVNGVGLIVAGGSDQGAGLEILADGATAFITKSFPADPTIGAAAVIDPSGGIALLGGTTGGMPAPARHLDPKCPGGCTVTEIKNVEIPTPITRVVAYALGGTRFIVIGDEVGGMGLTRSFLVDLSGSVTELPLREPRIGATAIPTPTGLLAILGGVHPDNSPALSVELFLPQ